MIDKHINKDKYEFEVKHTEYPQHATELAKSATNSDIDIVCAIGGDGTVNECAKALVHTNTALAIIPSGSGNGLARHLHIPTDPTKAIELINEGNEYNIDYGIANSTPFFCTCGVGFDAFISMKFAEAGKRGATTYIENVFKSGLKYIPEQYDLEFINDGKNEKHTYKAFLISCANASQYGNNAYIAPLASVRDGLMDVTIIEPFNIVDAPVMAVQLFNGTINQNFRIKTHKCKKLIINRTASGEFHYDGEPIVTNSRIEIEIIPSALKCICPLDEGVRELGENLQTMISEQFTDLRLRSEQMLQNGLNSRKRSISKVNSKIIRNKKNNHNKGE